MGLLQRVFGVFFSRRGIALARYKAGMTQAKAGNFQDAIREYTHAIDAPHVPKDVQAMAIYNRSLAYSSTGNEEQAEQDLVRLLKMEHLPDRIRTQAIHRQHRLQKRHLRQTEGNETV